MSQENVEIVRASFAAGNRGNWEGVRERSIPTPSSSAAWEAGRSRGPELNAGLTVVCTMREGKISVMEYFWDHAEALETLGLSEQDAHPDT
jgi:hypothetical protein